MAVTTTQLGFYSAKFAYTTGSEAAPTTVANGMQLDGSALNIHAEAAAAMTAGGKLECYIWNIQTLRWNRCPDLDLVVAALQYQAFPGFTVPGSVGRIVWVPNGVGQAVTVYVNGAR